MARSGTNRLKCAARSREDWAEEYRMRLLARTAVWTAAPALLLLAGCGVQPGAADESESVELRSPSVESAVHHDLSAPLELILPVRPSLEEREHPVKPIPRR